MRPTMPVTVAFSEEAQVIRNELATKHLEMQSVESINNKLASHIGKYDGVYARLCLLFHCIEHAGRLIPTTISGDNGRTRAKQLPP